MDNKIKSGIKSLFTAAKNAATGVDQSVPVAVSDERMSICAQCPKLIKMTTQCSECGCFLNLKTKLRQEKCPLGKWSEWKDENGKA